MLYPAVIKLQNENDLLRKKIADIGESRWTYNLELKPLLESYDQTGILNELVPKKTV